MDGILIISLFYLLRGEAHCPGDVRRYPVFTGILEYVLWSRDSVCCSPVFLQRKKGQAPWKYAFYWFYPLHLMVLFFIRLYVVGIPLG